MVAVATVRYMNSATFAAVSGERNSEKKTIASIASST